MTGSGAAMSLLQQLERELPHFRYRFRTEKELHDGIAAVLHQLDVVHRREVAVSATDRFDFLCAGGLVIEAKIDGSWSEALRQVDRYCQRIEVTAVLVATTKLWGLSARIPQNFTLRDKPVRLAHLEAQAF